MPIECISHGLSDVHVLEPMSYDMLPNIMFGCYRNSMNALYDGKVWIRDM